MKMEKHAKKFPIAGDYMNYGTQLICQIVRLNFVLAAIKSLKIVHLYPLFRYSSV